MIEEGNPDFIEQAIGQILRKADLQTKLHGKGLLPMAGEYTPLVLGKGLAVFCTSYGHATPALSAWIAKVDAQTDGSRQGAGRSPAAAAADLLHGLSRSGPCSRP